MRFKPEEENLTVVSDTGAGISMMLIACRPTWSLLEFGYISIKQR